MSESTAASVGQKQVVQEQAVPAASQEEVNVARDESYLINLMSPVFKDLQKMREV